MCGFRLNPQDVECWQCGESLHKSGFGHAREPVSPARPVIALQLLFVMLVFFVRKIDRQAARNLAMTSMMSIAIFAFPLATAIRIHYKQQSWFMNRYALIATLLLSAVTFLMLGLI